MPHLGRVNVVLLLYATLVGFQSAPLVGGVLLLGVTLTVQSMATQALGYWRTTDRRDGTRVVRTALNAIGLCLYWAF